MRTIFILLLSCFFVSCVKNVDKYDGLVLIDQNTNKRYILRHNVGDSYFIYEESLYILGKDTTTVFR